MIDNAEEIVGHYDFQTGVSIMVSLRPNDVVEIDVTTTYLPMKIGTKKVCSLIRNQSFIFTDGDREIEIYDNGRFRHDG